MATDPALQDEQNQRMDRLQYFNTLNASHRHERADILRELLAQFGEGSYIEPPLYANWAGKFLHIKENVYINFGCTMVDDGDIDLDDYVLVSPNVTFISGTHPVQPQLRKEGYQYTAPIHVCENAWIGAGAILLPGVCIGANSIIGAGSVVTHDIEENCVAVGNPCRKVRQINERDDLYYYKDRKIPACLYHKN